MQDEAGNENRWMLVCLFSYDIYLRIVPLGNVYLRLGTSRGGTETGLADASAQPPDCTILSADVLKVLKMSQQASAHNRIKATPCTPVKML